MKGEEAEKQFNKLAKSNLKIAVDEARDTEESKGEENTKHTSGGVFIAIDGARSSVVHKEEGAMRAIPCNGGRLLQAWITVKAGLQAFFDISFWHSEGWSQRDDRLFEAGCM